MVAGRDIARIVPLRLLTNLIVTVMSEGEWLNGRTLNEFQNKLFRIT
jgi:hypothetical protein